MASTKLLEGQIQKVEMELNNPSFLEHAPTNVIQAKKDLLEKLRGELKWNQTRPEVDKKEPRNIEKEFHLAKSEQIWEAVKNCPTHYVCIQQLKEVIEKYSLQELYPEFMKRMKDEEQKYTCT